MARGTSLLNEPIRGNPTYPVVEKDCVLRCGLLCCFVATDVRRLDVRAVLNACYTTRIPSSFHTRGVDSLCVEIAEGGEDVYCTFAFAFCMGLCIETDSS